MSSEALAWAFKQNCPSSSTKFTLVALCECANYKTGRIYPSIEHITEITGQNRKTVISNISELERLGFITDTGERMGRTKQIKVYQAVLDKVGSSKKECHYVYRLTNPLTGEFYIGVRSFLGEPDVDSYKGSGRWPSGAAYHGIELHKEVLAVFDTRNEAEIAEANSIAANIALPLCRNIKQESHKRDTIPETELLNSPAFAPKQSQKRDMEPSLEPTDIIPNGITSKRTTPAKPKFELPDWIPTDAWDGFEEMRRSIRKPMTDRARGMIVTELQKLRGPPGAILDQSTRNNWQDVFELKDKTNGQSRNQQGGMGTTERAAHRALSEITGGTGSFASGGGPIPPSDTSGGYRTIDAVPDTVRAIGYAGG